MPDVESERTRVDRLLTEAGGEIEAIKTAVGGLSICPSREQIEGLIVRLGKALEKIQQAGLDHKAYYQTAHQLKQKYEEMIAKLKTSLEVFKAELKEYKPIVEENERLRLMLQQAGEQIQALKEEIDKLSAPPNGVGVVDEVMPDGKVWIFAGGRKMRVNARSEIDLKSLRPGQEVVLNDLLSIVEIGRKESQGEVVTLEELMEDGRRVKVNTRLDESRIVELAEPLRSLPLKVGDLLLFDPRSGYCVERLPKNEAQDLLLFEVPDVTFGQVGGLSMQIEEVHEAIELPFLYPEDFKEHKLRLSKGVLLYGPPGCGKTLIAKAVANSLAKRIEEKTGVPAKSYFLNIKGPELLTKWVGETERKIREIFQRSREKASEGMPVVIFFDELDSMLRTRGSGISSDVESTIVPQFLAEIDGVESLKNVIVIGASNRQDLIDPAVLRPGRFDVKILVGRPDREGAKEIFRIYLTEDLPFHPKYTDEKHPEFRGKYRDFKSPKDIVEYMIQKATARLWSTDKEPYHYKIGGQQMEADNRIVSVTTRDGKNFYLYLKDFVSGAMIESVVTRAKKSAFKRKIKGGEKGIKTEDLCVAVGKETDENQYLPNTSAGADEWLRMQGYREEVVRVTLVDRKEKPRPVEEAKIGHYL